MRYIILAAIAVAATLCTGCASIIGSKVQPVIVSTTCGDQPVIGAQCRLVNSKGSYTILSTPGVAMITKASSGMSVECKNGTVQGSPDIVSSHPNAGMYGNILIGGLVGFGVDGYTDMGWNYSDDVTVDMCHNMPQRNADTIRGAKSDGPVAAVAAGSNGLGGMQTVAAGEWKYAFGAEELARQRQCTASPRAVLSARGPATEIYTVACNNGDALMLKCTWGDCKAI